MRIVRVFGYEINVCRKYFNPLLIGLLHSTNICSHHPRILLSLGLEMLKILTILRPTNKTWIEIPTTLRIVHVMQSYNFNKWHFTLRN